MWQHEMAISKISVGVECDFGSGVVFCLGCGMLLHGMRLNFFSRNGWFGFLCYFLVVYKVQLYIIDGIPARSPGARLMLDFNWHRESGSLYYYVLMYGPVSKGNKS